jgi:hypothetical protein
VSGGEALGRTVVRRSDEIDAALAGARLAALVGEMAANATLRPIR